MRIALVSSYSWTYPGGVTRHIESLAEQYIAAGHEVRVLSPVDPDDRLTVRLHRGARPSQRPLPDYLLPIGRTLGFPAVSPGARARATAPSPPPCPRPAARSVPRQTAGCQTSPPTPTRPGPCATSSVAATPSSPCTSRSRRSPAGTRCSASTRRS